MSLFTKGNGVMDYRSILEWDKPSLENKKIHTRVLLSEERDLPVYADLPGGAEPAIYLDTPLKPIEAVKELFDNNLAAMDYVSRPVCSLEDYIDFYAVAGRGSKNLDPVGRGRGIRVGPTDENGAVPTYYSVIRQFIGGPGVEPGAKVDSKTDTGAPQQDFRVKVIGEGGIEVDAIVVPVGQIATFADLPDSSKDWQSLLLDYRAIIESLEPQGSHSADKEVLNRRASS
jgi:hypothetical protein